MCCEYKFRGEMNLLAKRPYATIPNKAESLLLVQFGAMDCKKQSQPMCSGVYFRGPGSQNGNPGSPLGIDPDMQILNQPRELVKGKPVADLWAS